VKSADSPTPDATFRERLLEALAESIREKGLQRTQITDIVRIARTSRRTFYECFADKESCFIEMIDAARVSVQEEIVASVDAQASWPVQIDQAVDAFLGALARDPALTVTISRELPALGFRGFAFQREGTELYAELVVGLSQSDEMRRAGVMPISTATAVMLVGGISELIDRAGFRGEPVESQAPVIKAVVKAVLDPAAARSSPGRPKPRQGTRPATPRG